MIFLLIICCDQPSRTKRPIRIAQKAFEKKDGKTEPDIFSLHCPAFLNHIVSESNEKRSSKLFEACHSSQVEVLLWKSVAQFFKCRIRRSVIVKRSEKMSVVTCDCWLLTFSSEFSVTTLKIKTFFPYPISKRNSLKTGS